MTGGVGVKTLMVTLGGIFVGAAVGVIARLRHGRRHRRGSVIVTTLLGATGIALLIVGTFGFRGRPPTVVRFYTPFGTDIARPSVPVGRIVVGDCFWGSVANSGRADAWRCESRDRIYDPCFAPDLPNGYVLCPSNPWGGPAVRMEYSGRLPRRHGNRDSNMAPPWFLELETGERCSFATGATVAIAGERANYQCPGGAWLVGEIKRGRSWVALVARPNSSELERAFVTTAWY